MDKLLLEMFAQRCDRQSILSWKHPSITATETTLTLNSLTALIHVLNHSHILFSHSWLVVPLDNLVHAFYLKHFISNPSSPSLSFTHLTCSSSRFIQPMQTLCPLLSLLQLRQFCMFPVNLLTRKHPRNQPGQSSSLSRLLDCVSETTCFFSLFNKF